MEFQGSPASPDSIFKGAGISCLTSREQKTHLAVGQNPVPLVNIKIGGTWVFTHPKMEPLIITHGHFY